MRFSSKHLIAAVLALTLSTPLAALAAKKYQVTGTVVSLTEKTIVVLKADGDKWEIERNDDTKVEGKLKVGNKVTIYYHMIADSAETR